jgi:aryl-alcohol dehydrogenase-like predicted oxidoreductase
MMYYGKIGSLEREVSRIMVGTAAEPFLSGGDACDILDRMFSLGINTIDTARNYGLAERSVGDWMEKRGNRADVVILSKCAHPDENSPRRVSEKDIREDFEVSSGYLRTDYIDIYLLHRDDTSVPAGEVIEIMNALHEEGKIGVFGASNWTMERITEANEYAEKHGLIPFTVSSPNYCLAHQVTDMWGGGVTITGPENADVREWYRSAGMPIVAHSPLARGFLTGRVKSGDPKSAEVLDNFAKAGFLCDENLERLRRSEIMAEKKNCTVAQLSLAWIFSSPLDVYTAISTSNKARMEQNIAALDIRLTPAERDYLDLVTDLEP